jgi:hypothetical protein
MKSFSFKEPWLNAYVERLLGLSTATKKVIIDLLQHSIHKEAPIEPKPKTTSMDAFGMWEGDGTAEELAKSIRDARYNREKDLDW